MYNCLENEIINICHYEYNNFLNKANVVGIGYGYKYIKNIQTNEKVLHVFVEKKVPLSCLYKKDIIPSLYKNIKTDVIETGTFRVKSLTKKVRPVTGGYGFGLPEITHCGTFGGIVTDGDFFYMLSNNHVIANDNLTPIGTPILQPCIKHGGQYPQDIVALLSRFIKINFITPTERPRNYVDAAMAKVINEDLVSPQIEFVGIPKGTNKAALSMNIKMVGEISELVLGSVTSLHVAAEIRYSEEKSAIYIDQFLFDIVVQNGDSGALILDCNNNVIGLNFAGSQVLSIANPISYVLSGLQVEMVTSNNYRGIQLSHKRYGKCY